MKFEYDSNKSITNRQKHGVDFEEAKTIWNTDNVILRALSIDEDRYMIIGEINGRLYSCIYTLRGEIVRIISCRRSRNREEKIYYEKIR